MLIFSPTRLAKISRKIIANPYVASALPLGDAEIQSIFEPWQLAEFPEKTRQSEPFDYEDIEMEPPTCCWSSRPGNGCWLGKQGTGVCCNR